MHFLKAAEASRIDSFLMDPSKVGYTLAQLMELAGYSVASAIATTYPITTRNKVLFCIGPGNNGGDGLVAARHLATWGYSVSVLYSKRKPQPEHYYNSLVKQLDYCSVNWLNDLENKELGENWDLVVDALFGFSFSGALRSPFDSIVQRLVQARDTIELISVDVPSGWDVDKGPPADSSISLLPNMLVSLTAPKECAKFFKGAHHFLGGRFISRAMAEELGLDEFYTNCYPASSPTQIVKLN